MADKFNLEGFSVSEFNTLTVEGGIHGGTGRDMTIAADLSLQINSLTELILASTTKIVRMPFGLPTSDPVSSGQLWSDSGTVKISAG